MLLDIDGRRGEKAGDRETSLAIPFIVIVKKLQEEHRLYFIRSSANYPSISVIRTSFSIVRPSIRVDINVRHYFINHTLPFLSFPLRTLCRDILHILHFPVHKEMSLKKKLVEIAFTQILPTWMTGRVSPTYHTNTTAV